MSFRDKQRPAAPRLSEYVAVLLFAAALCSPGASFAHLGVDQQLEIVTDQIKDAPASAALYLKRGELHRVHRDWDLAQADYQKARKLDPDLEAVDLAWGSMLLDAGRFKDALAPLSRFLTGKPDHVRARVARARSLAHLRRYAEAVKDFDHALRAASGGTPRPEYFLERARAEAARGARRIPHALAGLDDGLTALGYPVTLQLYAIDLELERQNIDGALMRIDQIANSTRRNETWLIRKGEILEGAGRTEQARQAFLGALESIEALPATRRRNRAVERLETAARSGMERLR